MPLLSPSLHPKITADYISVESAPKDVQEKSTQWILQDIESMTVSKHALDGTIEELTILSMCILRTQLMKFSLNKWGDPSKPWKIFFTF